MRKKNVEEYEEDVSNQLEKLNLSERIKFAGPGEECLRRSDALKLRGITVAKKWSNLARSFILIIRQGTLRALAIKGKRQWVSLPDQQKSLIKYVRPKSNINPCYANGRLKIKSN